MKKKSLLSSTLNHVMMVIQFIGLNTALLLCFTTQVKAQGHLPGGFSHIIEVGRYSDWGKGYLTITDLNYVFFKGEYCFFTFDFTDEFKNSERPWLGNLIIEVDGVSAEGWTKEQFYNKVDNRHDTITLKIRANDPRNGVHDFITKIYPLYEIPNRLKKYGNNFAFSAGTKLTKLEKRQRQDKRQDNKHFIFEERRDEEFDLFPCRYYDYIITSNDPLLDKDILKQLNTGLELNEEKPDILFTIARDAKESITSTYIPPSSRVVNTGSTTTARYNFLTRSNDYITRQNNQVVYEGGYTQETKTADIFLEITALDAKKINDKNATQPPIIWKATVKRHVLNPQFNINDELKAYASWMAFNPWDRYFVQEDSYLFAPLGIKWIENIIQEVATGSRAEEIGLKEGDKILKVDLVSDSKTQRNSAKEYFKRRGLMVLEAEAYKGSSFNIQILRNGNKLNLNVPPSRIDFTRLFLVGGK